MYKNMRVSVIIAAAGKGSRMGAESPKQFLKIGGKPILQRTVEAFSLNASIDDVIISADGDTISSCRELFPGYGESGSEWCKVMAFVPGGCTRQESVAAGLSVLPGDTEIVLVHDGARPFVTDVCIDEVVSLAAVHGAACAAVPVIDTVKICVNGVFTSTLDRNNLYAVQTPQGFRKDIILRAYDVAFCERYTGTDDAVLVERMGVSVFFARGDYNNIKITVPDDLIKAEVIAAEREARLASARRFGSIALSAVSGDSEAVAEYALISAGARRFGDIALSAVSGDPEAGAEYALRSTGARRFGDIALSAVSGDSDVGAEYALRSAGARRFGDIALSMASGDSGLGAYTGFNDICALSQFTHGVSRFRVGTGYDAHKFSDNRPLILAGVYIPYKRGLLGHSDADVLVHALMDALLGAAALGDIGKFFPDSESAYKGISSIKLLDKVMALLREAGWAVVNADTTIIAEEPKMAGFIDKMRSNLASALALDVSAVSVKATTTEGLGFTGRCEGVAAQASVLLLSSTG